MPPVSGRDRTEDWTFGGTWPFEPRWFAADAGRLHYVDEGPRDGTPVVTGGSRRCSTHSIAGVATE